VCVACDVDVVPGSILLVEGRDPAIDRTIDMLRPIRAAVPQVSWADLIQMARAVAVQARCGVKIPMRYGRVDATEIDSLMRTKSTGVVVETRDGRCTQKLVQDSFDTAIKQFEDTSTGAPHIHGLDPQLSLAIAGDVTDKFTNAGARTLCRSEGLTDRVLAIQHSLYAHNELAFTRDYSLAHSTHSDVGALFQPASGVYR